MDLYNKMIAAAIDFGTTSGLAFSFNHEYKIDRTKVIFLQRKSLQGITLKVPTTILIKPDGETFDSFGYDAEDNYMELAYIDKHKEWYYFRHFTMAFHGKMKIDRNMKLKDETQKSMLAMKVFSLSIRYMTEYFLKTINKDQLTSDKIKENEIMWVLTLPALWDDAAKQFMMEAAIMAGIKENNFKIALEPETASLYCLCLPVDKMVQGGGMSSFKAGSKHMVLDAGGSIIDITVQEVLSGCKLNEIYKATGFAWGGTQVDEAFKQYLISVFGTKVFSRFQTEKKNDYLDLFRDFELEKRLISPERVKKLHIRLPFSLNQLYLEENGETMSKAIEKTIHVDQISLSGDKLGIEDFVVKGFFSETIQNIISHVKHLMKETKVKEISSILMVGGFSESTMLQEAIKSNFSNLRLIIPQNAGLVALMGAVGFGHSHNYITERVGKYTYDTSKFDGNWASWA